MSDLLTGPVEVIGTGMLGTSVGLACRRVGLEVVLRTCRPSTCAPRRGSAPAGPAGRGPAPARRGRGAARPPRRRHPRGAGRLGRDGHRRRQHQDRAAPGRCCLPGGGPVRRQPPDGRQRAVRAAGGQRGPLRRPAVGGHAPRHLRSRGSRGWSRSWRRACGGVPVRMTPEEHDHAVARTSHLPHLLAVLTAGRLAGAPPEHLALSGQGVRDVTRVAGSDPAMWQQIVALNADALRGVLAEVREELDALQDAVIGGDRDALGGLLGQGSGRHPRHPGQARRPGGADHVGVRLRPRPSRGAGPAVRRRGRQRRQHRGRPHRPRPRPPGRAGGAGGRARAVPSICWALSNPVDG